ncbi:hypothetical protein WN51_05897 [Melipona quadrifasciata]|uniref:Uncharacterized protein n=1 Tax=Melipona quadrifasciata TaxID=166423 RepID=A0A0M9A8G5_9HYME|nr:hypothetical protein WN51_05897 [Melipona quadrifasciata]
MEIKRFQKLRLNRNKTKIEKNKINVPDSTFTKSNFVADRYAVRKFSAHSGRVKGNMPVQLGFDHSLIFRWRILTISVTTRFCSRSCSSVSKDTLRYEVVKQGLLRTVRSSAITRPKFLKLFAMNKDTNSWQETAKKKVRNYFPCNFLRDYRKRQIFLMVHETNIRHEDEKAQTNVYDTQNAVIQDSLTDQGNNETLKARGLRTENRRSTQQLIRRKFPEQEGRVSNGKKLRRIVLGYMSHSFFSLFFPNMTRQVLKILSIEEECLNSNTGVSSSTRKSFNREIPIAHSRAFNGALNENIEKYSSGMSFGGIVSEQTTSQQIHLAEKTLIASSICVSRGQQRLAMASGSLTEISSVDDGSNVLRGNAGIEQLLGKGRRFSRIARLFLTSEGGTENLGNRMEWNYNESCIKVILRSEENVDSEFRLKFSLKVARQTSLGTHLGTRFLINYIITESDLENRASSGATLMQRKLAIGRFLGHYMYSQVQIQIPGKLHDLYPSIRLKAERLADETNEPTVLSADAFGDAPGSRHFHFGVNYTRRGHFVLCHQANEIPATGSMEERAEEKFPGSDLAWMDFDCRESRLVVRCTKMEDCSIEEIS